MDEIVLMDNLKRKRKENIKEKGEYIFKSKRSFRENYNPKPAWSQHWKGKESKIHMNSWERGKKRTFPFTLVSLAFLPFIKKKKMASVVFPHDKLEIIQRIHFLKDFIIEEGSNPEELQRKHKFPALLQI